VACKACGALEQGQCRAEISIYFPEPLNDLGKLPVLVFPKLLICFQCGQAEFAVPQIELSLLMKGKVAAGPESSQSKTASSG
jgi:hypothetical protein